MPKISSLATIASIDSSADVLAIVDTSASATRKATPSALVKAGLEAGVTLSNNVVIDGGLTKDVEFNDIATMTLDATTLNLSGVASVSVRSTGAGASQGQVEIRADQQLTVLTPAVVAQTAAVGQVLQLTDAVNGVVEFADSSSAGAVKYDSAQSLSSTEVNQAFANLKRRQVAFLLKKGIITAAISTVARTSNVATVVTDVAHGMIVGQKVSVNATTDNTFDATDVTVIAVPTTTSFTYSSAGSDKAATSDTGTLTTWEVVNDSSHGSWGNPRIQSISGSTITITFDAIPVGCKVLYGTIGNHSNSYNGRIVPQFGAIGISTISFQFRQRELIHGRVYWNGTTTGGGTTSNNNWVKEGDSSSASFVGSTINALFIGHSSNRITTSGSRGASSWVPPMITGPSGIRHAMPNFQVSPFTAAAYQPSETGFYMQLVNHNTGAILDQTALEAMSPASTVQVVWSREIDALVADITAMPFTVTVWANVTFLTP